MNIQQVITVCAISVGFQAHAFECNFDKIASTTPIEKFLDNNDGTVTDLRFGLMWKKCTHGQSYDPSENTCVGEGNALNSWSESLNSQTDLNADKFAGFDDWRLPNIKELHSIIERACKNPAIRPEIFPDSINAPYWSNTPDNEVNPALLGRIVDFADGTEFLKATNINVYVRHVRLISD